MNPRPSAAGRPTHLAVLRGTIHCGCRKQGRRRDNVVDGRRQPVAFLGPLQLL